MNPLLLNLPVVLALACEGGLGPAQDYSEDCSQFGESVALCGDLDGDGCSEIAIADGISGEIFIFSGKDGSLLRTLEGGGSRWLRVSSLPDRDSDDVLDIAVVRGTFHFEAKPARVSSDRITATIFSGRNGKEIERLQLQPLEEDTALDLLVLAEWTKGDPLRSSYRSEPPTVPWRGPANLRAALGDYDGDGRVDVALVTEKHVLVIVGEDQEGRIQIKPRGHVRKVGLFLVNPGDLNGDGADDLVVSTTDVSWTGPNGSRSSSVQAWSVRERELLWHVTGSRPLHDMGHGLARAGDVNGDGTPDVLTAIHASFRSRLICLSGKDGTVLRQTEDNQAGLYPEIGGCIDGGHDVDGDGIPDFLSGLFNYGCIGLELQGARVYSGKDGSLIHAFSLRAGRRRDEEAMRR